MEKLQGKRVIIAQVATVSSLGSAGERHLFPEISQRDSTLMLCSSEVWIPVSIPVSAKSAQWRRQPVLIKRNFLQRIPQKLQSSENTAQGSFRGETA